MKNNKLARQLALLSASALFATAQGVSAHTGIRDVVTEGVVSWNAVKITHGCNSNENETAPRLDVIAASVLFPNAADPTMAVITQLDPTTGAVMGTVADLSNDIVGQLPGKGFITLGAGLVQPNLFPNFIPVIDAKTLIGAHASPLVRGFQTTNGPLPYASAPMWESIVSTNQIEPFVVGPVSFQPTSCALSLKVRVATADWCLSGTANNAKANRMDVWIGHMTPKFNASRVMPYSAAQVAAGSGEYWPTMTIQRNLTTNPLPSSCGAGYNLAIEPADADIDANLPIHQGAAPAKSPQYYWPN
jgi:hypothetical protein